MADRLSTEKNYVLTDPSGSETRITAEMAASYNRGANKLVEGYSVKYSPLKAATQIINQAQDEEIASSKTTDDAPTRSSASSSLAQQYTDAYSSLSALFDSGTRPEVPSYRDMYADLRDDYNMDDLEDQLNDLQTEEESIYATLRTRRNAERDKPVAMNVIEGRINETERQEMERIDYIGRQKNTLVRQLQAANSTIENMMNLTKMDYEAARASYNDQFSQQMTMFNTVRGVVDAENAQAEREADNARANLNIIYNSIKDGGMDKENLDPAMKYQINQLELSAGLPTGFYANIAEENPNGKILSTTTRTSSGGKYVDLIMQNKDGSLTTKSMYLGSVDTTGGSDKDGDGIPDPDISWEEYLKIAQDELSMSINPESDLYADLKAAYERDFLSTVQTEAQKFTSTEIKKLEQAGLLYAPRQDQLDFLYGKEASDGIDAKIDAALNS